MDEDMRTLSIMQARTLYPASETIAYFNTAAIGLASTAVAVACHEYLDDWTTNGLDYYRGEEAAANARQSVAALLGVDAGDVALIASVSAAAGLIAAQFGPARDGQNVVIGEREYASNHFPWRQLAHKGYEVRQVPFRNGGLEPDDVGRHIDAGTQLVAFSAVQSATGHRSDIASIGALAREVGALVFVDGTQIVGASSVTEDLAFVDVLATGDHKYLLSAGRGMGYCYLSARAQDEFVPVSAGWKAGAVPFDSFYGPAMNLSTTASRFDQSISWLAAVGNEASLSVFTTFGADVIYARNRELSDLLRAAVVDVGWRPIDLPEANRSTIVSVPLGGTEPVALLADLKKRALLT